jgi:hypothetical protein
MVSGFKSNTYSPAAILMAWLLATANPVFTELHINLIVGNFSLTSATLPSTELLSTTKTSASISFIEFKTEYKHCSKKCLTL